MYSKIMADEYLRKEENILKISDVRIRFVKKEDSKLKAVASITIDDCFVVHDIKIIEGKDIAHPLNTETREELKKAILDVYSEELEKAE